MPFTDLWKTYDEWYKCFQDYYDRVFKLQEEIRRQGESWGIEIHEGFELPAFRIIDGELFCLEHGWGKYARAEFNYEGKKLIAIYADKKWDILEAEVPSQYIPLYDDMCQKLLQGEEFKRIYSIHTRLDRLNARIQQLLRDILERRDYIWPTCPLCPSPPNSSAQSRQ